MQVLLLVTMNEMTNAQISRALKKQPQQTLRMIKHLKEGGLIEQTRTKMVRNLQEKYYRAKAKQFTVDLSVGESEELIDRIGIHVRESIQALESAIDLSKEKEERMAEISISMIKRVIEIQNELMGKMGINNVSIPLIACSMTDEKLTELAKELREMVGMLEN